jgi:hypothetical protein
MMMAWVGLVGRLHRFGTLGWFSFAAQQSTGGPRLSRISSAVVVTREYAISAAWGPTLVKVGVN